MRMDKRLLRAYGRVFTLIVIALIINLPVVFSWQISNLQVSNITHNSATVSWETGTQTQGELNYGETTARSNQMTSPLGSNHTFYLTGLNNNEKIYYEAKSIEPNGETKSEKMGYNEPLYFETKSPPDTQHPSITTGPSISLPSDSQATISWATDEPTDAVVSYGTDQGNLDSEIEKNQKQTSHSVTLDGLTKDTKYYYSIRYCDASGNCESTSTDFFVAGQDSTPPTISLNLPEKYGKSTITFDGQTEPFALVKLYINDSWVSHQTADADGDFTFHSLTVSGYGSVVNMKFVAEDQVGLTVEKSHVMEVNFDQPHLTVEMPSNVTDHVTVTGSVDQLCDVTFRASSQQDQNPPVKVTGLRNTTVGTNSVALEWEPVDDAIHEYAVYRDGRRITTVSGESFEDSGAYVASGQTYTYKVSAVDENCNEGPKSSGVSVTTVSGGSMTSTQEPPATNLTCDVYSYSTTMKVQGSFTQDIPLEQGPNHIEIVAENDYGNKDTYTTTVNVDTESPEITETNLEGDTLSPSYSSQVKIRGKVSEASTIYAYLNGESSPSASKEVSSAGDFSIEVNLERGEDLVYTEDSQDEDESLRAEGSLPNKWENVVELEAVDDAGHRSERVTGTIVYAMCGAGHWFNVDVRDPTEILNPRLMIEGMAQIGMSLDIEWVGGSMNDVTITDVKIHQRPLSLEEMDDWDTEWISVSKRGDTVNHTNWYGYVQLKLRSIDPSPSGSNWTIFQKEENLSKHRQGECVSEAFGCVRYPLMVEVMFEQDDLNYSQKQRTCIDVETQIENRIPPDYIPEEFLESSVDFLNSTIEAIDQVLEPLSSVTEYAMYGCLVMMGVNFLLTVRESYQCHFSNLVTTLTGDGFSMAVAQMGLCEQYGDDGDSCTNSASSACTACEQCQDAIEQRKDKEAWRNMLCDRVFCPSVPTFQRFVKNSKDKLEDEIGDASSWEEAKDELIGKDSLEGFDANGVSLDCAYDSISINNYLVENSGDEYETPEICTETLHPPMKQCCRQEYLDRWDSACIFMDEFKESGCLYAQLTDHPAFIDPSDESTRCNVIWNSAAGFCDAKGGAKPEIIRANDFFVKPECIDGSFSDYMSGRIDSHLFFRVTLPQQGEDGSVEESYLVEPGYVTKDMSYDLADEAIEEGKPSVVNSQTVFQPLDRCSHGTFGDFFNPDAEMNQQNEGERFNYEAFSEELNKIACQKDLSYASQQDATIRQSDVDAIDSQIEQTRNDDSLSADEKDAKIEQLEQRKEEYERRLDGRSEVTYTERREVTCEGGDQVIYDTDKEEVKELHQKVQDELAISDKKYVVNPADGFLRSIQCACLPAVKSYLSLYRNMMMAVKNCFQTILLTGDGESGMCRSVISVYVCDLLYEVIRCFMERYGATGARGDTGGSIGNFMGAIVDAQNKVTNSVQSRYGGSQMFNAMFGETKLVHSLCMFAFTGTWDMDVGGMFDSAGPDMPVKSMGAVYPCERRYVSYDQSNDGIATFNYKIGAGIVAGANLHYRLELVCSDGLECSPQEGFTNGQCDCPQGEERRTLRTGEITSGGRWDDEVFKNLADGVRYDKAVLTWEYENNNGDVVSEKATCDIKQAGGKPPAFCEYSAGMGKFVCNLNIGDDTYAHFNGEPRAEPSNGDFFVLDETMSFSVPIQYKKPQNWEESCNTRICPYTKWAGVEVKHNGVTVAESSPVRITSEGTRDVSLRVRDALSEADFTGTGNLELRWISGFDNHDANVDCRGSNNVDQYLYVFHTSGNTWRYLFSDDDNLNKEELLAQGGNDIQRSASATSFAVTGDIQCDLDQSTGSTDFGFRIKPNQGGGGSCDNEEVQFDAVFSIYEATEEGGSWAINTEQVTYYEGEKQEKTLHVKAKCVESSQGGSTVQCPQPMHHSWEFSDYGVTGIAGQSTCRCGSGEICDADSASKAYCWNDGNCYATTEPIPDCPAEPMDTWQGVESGRFAECYCTNQTACSHSLNEYCVRDDDGDHACRNLPACYSSIDSRSLDAYYTHDGDAFDRCWCDTGVTCEKGNGEYCSTGPASGGTCEEKDDW